MMPATIRNTTQAKLVKRGLFKNNFAGNENNPSINGNSNQVLYNGPPPRQSQEPTLVEHTSSQVKKIMESGANLIITPGKWLMHMQENWLTYLVCITILMVCFMIIYCYVRRKISSFGYPKFNKKNMSAVMLGEAVRLAALRQDPRDI